MPNINPIVLKTVSGGGGAQEWVRHDDWLTMPTVLSTEEKVVILAAVFPDSQNMTAFRFGTSTGQYEVDWGDGNTTLHDSDTDAKKKYDYTTYDLSNTTLSSRGYKQVLITITPVSGNLITANFQIRHTGDISYSSNFLDMIISLPNHNTSGLTLGGGTVSHRNVERVNVLTIGNVTSLNSMFNSCFSLQSVPLFDTSSVTGMSYMFRNCYSLQSVPLFNTSSVRSMVGMFQNCSSLQSVPLFNTSSVTNMGNMFTNCNSLQTVPLFDTSSVTSMGEMFIDCLSLQTVPLFDTSLVTSMAAMFANCNSLQTVPLFDTSSVTSMGEMFFGCSSLQSVPLFNTSSVTSMGSMFRFCSSLQSVPLFNTSSVTNMGNMFRFCYSLQNIPLFDTSSVKSMSEMFRDCLSLQTVPLFDTSLVTSMAAMFANCNNLKKIPALSTNAITISSGTDFGSLFTSNCFSLERCEMIFARTTSIRNAIMTTDALEEVFTNLVDRSGTTSATITISASLGAPLLSQAQRDIALNKNWTIIG